MCLCECPAIHFEWPWATDSSHLHINLSPALLDSPVPHYLARLSLTSLSLSPHLSFFLSLPLMFSVRHPAQSQRNVFDADKTEHFSPQHCPDQGLELTWISNLRVCICLCLGSPLREDSPVGSPYAASASSPEQSLSSLSPPSSRHRIHRESPGLREPDDDRHTVNAPFQAWPQGASARVGHLRFRCA